MATTIRIELRERATGEREMWTNLADILKWLEELPASTNNRIMLPVALEIRHMLVVAIRNAEVISP